MIWTKLDYHEKLLEWGQIIFKLNHQGNLIEESLTSLHPWVTVWFSFSFDKGSCVYLEDRRDSTPLGSWQDVWSWGWGGGGGEGWIRWPFRVSEALCPRFCYCTNSETSVFGLKLSPLFLWKVCNNSHLRGHKKGIAHPVFPVPYHISVQRTQKCPL